MNLEILAPDEIRDRYPFIETHDLKGALYDPADGDIDPAQLTQALAKGARDLGAKILRFCPATGVEPRKRRVDRPYREGRHPLRDRGQRRRLLRPARRRMVQALGGRTVPMMVMSHQYMLFDEVPEVRDWSAEVGAQAAAAARRGRLLLPAAGEERLQPRPL
jgi:dimethylglycine dehydrogenase